jgi:hypothetical protein
MMKRLAVASLFLALSCIGAFAQNVCPNVYAAGTHCTPITGNAAGTTGAVVGTLLASGTSTMTFICGFSVDAIGGSAAVGPITLAGIVGSSMVFQLSSSATGTFRDREFNPCLAASAANTAITVSTTADSTATAVDVKTWGYQQ